MISYFANIRPGKMTLWCYLLWYLTTLYFYFDANPRLWLNSVGISAVIGLALMLSVSSPNQGSKDRWQTFRLFAMPFCVSSFSSLIKDQGFFLIIPPRANELVCSVMACAIFIVFVTVLKMWRKRSDKTA